MSITTKQPQMSQSRGMRRIWKAPTSPARWYFLVIWFLVCAGVAATYYYALKTQQQLEPFNDPLRIFGIIATVIVLITASYSLRRRFARGLPGKVQDWLWLHTWAGISAVIIALLHENFFYITHDFIQSISAVFDPFTYWGPAALFALILLVSSGILGRLLDVWQTRVIARDASSNGVGIVRALEERILELEYTIERLCAGKSEPFKQYCLQSLGRERGRMAASPAILPNEQIDFQRADDTLNTRANLVKSLHRQQRAQWIIRSWRTAHIALSIVALLIILFHSFMELLVNVFHIIQPA
jgi:hypothetical protein